MQKPNPLLFQLPCFILLGLAQVLAATTYRVGPGQPLASIGEAPWATLMPGDSVLIYHRNEPYREKWVINRQGTASQRIVVSGVPNVAGHLPVIEGENAVQPSNLNYWSETRGLIKIGGSNVPADGMPAFITLENLEIRNARPPFTFTGRDGEIAYAGNAASIFLEKGRDILIRNCVLRGSGNGFFSASQSEQVVVERSHIFDNGKAGSIYEHNNYTESKGITFQYNLFGPLRAGCPGNNLKDRSSRSVIRYNRIEGGNRQLDLVDSDHAAIGGSPEYRNTYVYGNVLVEPEGAGNRQIVHYGGDSGNESAYRGGVLHFFHNTVVSTRPDRTVMFRLSSAGESVDAWNNLFYVSAAGTTLFILEDGGKARLSGNWLKSGWQKSVSLAGADVTESGKNLSGADPGFANGETFHLSSGSPAIDLGQVLPGNLAVTHGVSGEYLGPGLSGTRQDVGSPDAGAFAFVSATGIGGPGAMHLRKGENISRSHPTLTRWMWATRQGWRNLLGVWSGPE